MTSEARPKTRRRRGESRARERPKTIAHLIGSGDEQRAQLVESGGARLHGASTLEQEQAQVLAPAASTRNAEPLAGEQPSRSQSRVDQVALATAPLLTPRPLTLVHNEASTLQEAHQPSPWGA
jgi:hypothetical protein